MFNKIKQNVVYLLIPLKTLAYEPSPNNSNLW